MWKLITEPLNSTSLRYSIGNGAAELTRAEVFRLWVDRPEFCHWFSDALLSCGFPAFFWETPPATTLTLHLPFECVVTAAPLLAGTRADPSAFANQISKQPNGPVIAFDNLGGDARLVIPTPISGNTGFAHLAHFLSAATPELIHELWKLVGSSMQIRISDKPLWLSTAGMGVPWLHVRLDARPKYYRHVGYK